MVKTMHRIFAGRTGAAAKLGMLATSLLVIAPIQIAVFLTNSAVVEGARSKEAILKVLKRGFAPVLGVTWITTPTAILFAEKLLPPEVRAASRIHRSTNAPSYGRAIANLFRCSSKFRSSISSNSAQGYGVLLPVITSPSIPLTPSRISAHLQHRCD